MLRSQNELNTSHWRRQSSIFNYFAQR